MSKFISNFICFLLIGLYFLVFCLDSKIVDIVCCIIGFLGFFYVLYFLRLIFLCPIKRDLTLISGNFLKKVITFVLFVPFVFSFAFIIRDNCCDCSELSDNTMSNLLFCEEEHTDERNHIFWTVYCHFVDPGNQHMSVSKVGRGLSALIAILGIILLNGLLVTTLIDWFNNRREQWINGSIRYKPRYLGKYKFAVVIGANEIAASVIKNLCTPKKDGEINYKCEGNNDYVILQTSRSAEEVRVELASHLTEEQLKKVIIYNASRDSVSELGNLYLEYSTEIYVLGESTLLDGGETYHDAMNMRCVNLIAKDLDKKAKKQCRNEVVNGDRSSRKVCKVMFEYQTTSSVFQFSDIPDDVKKHLVFIPFNRYESWARAVIVDNKSKEDCNDVNGGILNYTPLDGNCGISEDDDTHVHFVIVGMSKMGIAMGVQAMMQAHYLNFAKAESETDVKKRDIQKNARRTRITFIDSNADKEMAFFKGRYQNLFNLVRNRYIDATKYDKSELRIDWDEELLQEEWKHLSEDGTNFIDLEIEFIKGDVESDGIRTYLKSISNKNNSWVQNSNLTIAVCLTQTHQAVAASLYMPISVYDKAQEIWVYQRESADIVLNLMETNHKRYKKLKPFGMLYGEYMYDRSQYLGSLLVNWGYDLKDEIKKTGKGINVENRDLSKKETYADLRASWKRLSIDKQFSNRYFADSISLKIRSIKAVNLSLEDLKEEIDKFKNILARCEHNRWNVQQLLFGYSPCPKDIDNEIVELNSNCQLPCNKDAEEKWKDSVNWKNLSPLEKMEIKETDYFYKTLAKGIFDERKKSLKESEDRIHPNICDYNHLDVVDYGAKDYDITLNSIIPTIKLLVKEKI